MRSRSPPHQFWRLGIEEFSFDSATQRTNPPTIRSVPLSPRTQKTTTRLKELLSGVQAASMRDSLAVLVGIGLSDYRNHSPHQHAYAFSSILTGAPPRFLSLPFLV